MTRALVSSAVLLFLPGCFLAPGMRMNESAAVNRGRATTRDPSFDIREVTPAVVAQLLAERSRPPPEASDPLAERAVNYRYTIAPHDVLQVTVWDHPELTAPTGQFRSPEENGNPVNTDGDVFYPYVGEVHAAGLTVSELRRLLTRRLSQVVENPQLDVRIAAFRGKKVQITGEVTAPSTMPLTDVPLRIQDALAAAKGFTPEADFSRVTLSREGKTYVLNLQALYENGDMTQNWLLQDGDVVNVPDRSRNKVFVMGEVRAPQSRLMIRGRMTLAEALNDPAQPGVIVGFDPSASNVAQIFVIRGDYDAPLVFHLDASSADAMLLASQFPLLPRDVVFVSTYNVTRLNRVLLQVLPLVQGVWQTYDIVKRW